MKIVTLLAIASAAVSGVAVAQASLGHDSVPAHRQSSLFNSWSGLHGIETSNAKRAAQTTTPPTTASSGNCPEFRIYILRGTDDVRPSFQTPFPPEDHRLTLAECLERPTDLGYGFRDGSRERRLWPQRRHRQRKLPCQHRFRLQQRPGGGGSQQLGHQLQPVLSQRSDRPVRVLARSDGHRASCVVWWLAELGKGRLCGTARESVLQRRWQPVRRVRSRYTRQCRTGTTGLVLIRGCRRLPRRRRHLRHRARLQPQHPPLLSRIALWQCRSELCHLEAPRCSLASSTLPDDTNSLAPFPTSPWLRNFNNLFVRSLLVRVECLLLRLVPVETRLRVAQLGKLAL